jgi:hypothetical protein
MTREETISLLSQVNHILVNSNSWLENTHEPLNIAFDMAIKALEQKPCEDCVSRQAVLNLFNKSAYYSWEMCLLKRKIEELPSVTPTRKWIPCSERLPKKSGNYWCTFGGTNLTGKDYYTTESDAKEIFDEPEEYVGWQTQNVIAWMPLPEAYKPEMEE